jgi:hypothetical protein
MRHVKRNHQLAGLVKLYMEEAGLSLRSAQRHAKNEAPEWKQFVARHAMEAVKPGAKPDVRNVEAHMVVLDPEGPPPAPPSSGKKLEDEFDFDETGMIPEEVAMRTQWRMYQHNKKQALAFAKAGDAISAGAFSRNATDILKSYWVSVREWKRAMQDARQLVPAGEFEDFRRTVGQVAQVVRNGGKQFASQANPQNPGQAMSAFEVWLRETFSPAIVELLKKSVDGEALPAAA